MEWIYIVILWVIVLLIVIWMIWRFVIEAYPARMMGWLYTDKGVSPPFKVIEQHNRHPDITGILATSLYGNWTSARFQHKYYGKLLKNVAFLREMEWGKKWRYRVYLASNLKDKCLQPLLDQDVEVFIIDQTSLNPDESVNRNGSMWRFLAGQDDKPYIIVDADEYDLLNRLNTKEIDQWLKSDQMFYQNALYCINLLIPISCCCWGGKPRSLPQIDQWMNGLDHTWYGADEAFLTKIVPHFTQYGLYRVTNSVEMMTLGLALLCFGVGILAIIYWFLLIGR